MTNMYETGSAKILKIAVTGTDNLDELHNLLNENILQSVKICPNFTLKTVIVPIEETNFDQYNFVFYKTTFDKIGNDDTYDNIKKICIGLVDPRNHLFVVVDDCINLEIDDDGDLVFCDAEDNNKFQEFDESLAKIVNDNLFHACKISIQMSNIWKLIIDDSSIINLSEDQINILAPRLIKKSSKMSLVDKKREIKMALKKINKDDKLAETGYTELCGNVVQYFKLLHQKKIVCHNYLYAFNKVNVTLNNSDIDDINVLLNEIYGISYLKTEMHDDLIDKIDSILLSKLKQFYDKCKNNVAIDSNKVGSIDAYGYHKFLVRFMDIAKGYNLSNIMQITKHEIGTVNNLITEYHKKEMERVTDLDKISSYLEIFASKDKNNLIALFDKIRGHPKIMAENIEKMDKWIVFINKCLKLGIPKEAIMRLMEEIIMSKISFYTDTSRINNKDISVVYPQCLNVFLISNLNRNFVFKKLYMYISYSIRYSGRNISEYIKNIRIEQYQDLLKLENRLLELCTIPVEEQSQPMNLSDMDIVETFNENIPSLNDESNSSDTTNKKIKKTKIIKHNKKDIVNENTDVDSDNNNDDHIENPNDDHNESTSDKTKIKNAKVNLTPKNKITPKNTSSEKSETNKKIENKSDNAEKTSIQSSPPKQVKKVVIESNDKKSEKKIIPKKHKEF
ncbi:hypothetical protein QJ856_gp1030 [Tupanvirus deep ocean]|uniref:Uncharacterized protein n=2 Tax=Tupanvirus TaxID=2094720 RepID=A0AC62A7H5_9VIRU|nr:hypothetical protein QJ856_gp1030 [Tupanvirus deep ocean]QKU33727.1 hypothetical protein [Tupanvirus deep ocean]